MPKSRVQCSLEFNAVPCGPLWLDNVVHPVICEAGAPHLMSMVPCLVLLMVHRHHLHQPAGHTGGDGWIGVIGSLIQAIGKAV